MATGKSSPRSASPGGGAGHTLVIVESPTKANTIRKFLGQGFEVEASVGHIRDLVERRTDLPDSDPRRDQPWVKYGVNTSNHFARLEEAYIVPESRQRQVKALKQQLAKADRLFLATDDDREGEAISWHLLEVLQPKVPVQRLVFHEITREAIDAALAHPRQLNENLVYAQRTRRVVDRLYGWDVSEVLWRKIRPGLSAGRVQSVALRLLVERERERMAFVASDWASVHGNLHHGQVSFEATLTQLGGVRIAQGKDFDPATGALPAKPPLLLLDLAKATALATRLCRERATVASVDKKPVVLRPAPPFTTSTLQQEANRKLRWPAKQTMQTAQRLYESGLITYMRTDSVSLSDQAVGAARSLIAAQYGDSYVPDKPRRYANKVANAQEAHEAIRPAGTQFVPIDEVAKVAGREEARLYELIWKRTVASQMKDAELEQTSVDIAVDDALLRASGRVTRFAGFLKAYVEGSDDPDQALADRDTTLPALAPGDVLQWGEPALRAEGHTTQPPARLNDATLVKSLEEKGIGRPSTYAAILQSLADRGYAFRKGQALAPTFMGMAVVRLLEQHMPHLVDYGFTAQMEHRLDKIASGQDNFCDYLRGFYEDGLEVGAARVQGLRNLLQTVRDQIDPGEASAVGIGQTADGTAVQVRIGRYGSFVRIGQQTATVPDGLAPDEMTVARAVELVQDRARGEAPLGQSADGQPVFLRNGKYGWFLQQGGADVPAEQRKTTSLSPGMEPTAVTLEVALRQLGLPRVLGRQGAETAVVTAHVGRYGDYVQCGDERRNLPPGLWAIDVTLDQALALLAKPRGMRGREHLRDIGTDAQGSVISVWSGRYGLYLTDGKRNAPLKASAAPDQLTLDEALALLAAADEARTGKVLGPDPVSGQPVRLLDGRFGPYLTNGSVNASLARGTDVQTVTLEMALDRLQHFGKPVKAAKTRKGGAPRAAKAGTTSRDKGGAKQKATAKKGAAAKASPAATKAGTTSKAGAATNAKPAKTAAAKPAKAPRSASAPTSPPPASPTAAATPPRPTVVRRRPTAG